MSRRAGGGSPRRVEHRHVQPRVGCGGVRWPTAPSGYGARTGSVRWRRCSKWTVGTAAGVEHLAGQAGRARCGRRCRPGPAHPRVGRGHVPDRSSAKPDLGAPSRPREAGRPTPAPRSGWRSSVTVSRWPPAAATAPGAPARVGHVVDRPVEAADPLQPPEDVHAPIACEADGCGADGEHDLTTGPASSSASCTPVAEAPTTRTPPAGQRVRVAVRRRRQLVHGPSSWPPPRHRRPVAPAAGDHDVGRGQVPAVV